MTLQPMLIAPIRTGLDTDIDPWLAPIDSFTELNNFHIRHEALEKRSGYRVFAQLVPSGSTINISHISQANPGEVTTALAHGYSTGDFVYITSVTGMTEVNNKGYEITVTGGSTFTIGLDTSGFTAYAGGGTVALVSTTTDRCMGIYRYLDADGTKVTLAFTTTRAQKYDGVTNSFVELDAAAIMSGDEYDYIWATNWQSTDVVNRLYFTNGKEFDGATLDGIRYFDNSGGGTTTTSFTPNLNSSGTRILWGGKLLFVLKQRLIVLNTFERDTVAAQTSNNPQRARWCQAQGPSNWDDETPGGGGFVDAPTGDQILSARALKDEIIVYFTDSVWALRPVSDPALPFRWDKLNDFRACDGKMASVGYDRDVRALGVRGITASNSTQTQRIDERIEDFVTDEINVDEFNKVFCQRSYTNRRWWTLYPANESTENNSALIFDDESQAYSTYSIDLNCLGFGNFGQDFGLDDFTAANNLDLSLNDFSEETLQSYFWQDNQEALLGGNLNGTVFVLETENDDNQVEINTEFFSAGWNPFKKEGIEALMSYVDLYVDTHPQTTAFIEFFKDTDEAPYASQSMDFLPNLNFVATINNVSLTNPVNINAPQNGKATGDTVFIYGVKGTTEVNGGPYTITVVDANNFTLDGIDGTSFTAYSTGGQVVEREFYKTHTWKRVYAGGSGFEHRMRFTSTGLDSPIKIHALKPYFKARGKRTVN